MIAGPALGGVLLLLGSPALAFVVNALTFGVAAACVLAIRDGRAFASSPGGRGAARQPAQRASPTAPPRCGRIPGPSAWSAPTSCAAWSTACRPCC